MQTRKLVSKFQYRLDKCTPGAHLANFMSAGVDLFLGADHVHAPPGIYFELCSGVILAPISEVFSLLRSPWVDVCRFIQHMDIFVPIDNWHPAALSSTVIFSAYIKTTIVFIDFFYAVTEREYFCWFHLSKI